MSIRLDSTTQAEYAALETAALRAAAVVSALGSTVTVKVYDGSDTEMGAGTMQAPWATSSGATITVGEVSSFSVSQSGTPDATWYLQFAGNSRTVTGSFGLSGADFNWSLPTWEAGQVGTLGTVTITATGGNEAPVWIDAPTAASLGSSGGTIQFTASDPEGQTVVYGLSAKYLDSIQIAPATGLVTVPASAAGTSGNITVTATDGSLSADSVTCAVSVASGATLGYPRIGFWSLGYGMTSARANIIGKGDIAVLSRMIRTYSSEGRNEAQWTQYIKGINSAIKLMAVVNQTQVYYDARIPVLNSKLTAEKGAGGNGNWWLKTAAGAFIESWPGTYRTNVTALVTPDANGLRWNAWYARYIYAKASGSSVGTGDWTASGIGLEDCAYDGVCQDDFYVNYSRRVTADYDNDGVDEGGTTAEVQDWIVASNLEHVSAWGAINSLYWFGGNLSNMVSYWNATPDARMYGAVDFGFMEHMNLFDNNQTFATVMGAYALGLQYTAGGPAVFQWTLNARPTGMSEHQWARYGLAAALMKNGYFALPSSTSYNAERWMDEFDLDLGEPAESERTTAWSSGVWKREFEYGIALVNPRGNGPRTVALPSAGTGYVWRMPTQTAVAGSVTNTANNGSIISGNVSLADRDGLILRRVAA